MKNKILFHSKTFQNSTVSEFNPSPAKKFIPNWFMSADRYIRDKIGNIAIEFYKTKDGSIKFDRQHTFKSCPAVFDSLSSGYLLFTPCDIEIKKDKDSYSIKIDERFANNVNLKNFAFCNIRGEGHGFPTPKGYSPVHFTWSTNWFPQLPEGYIALFTHPINRFDLPFLTVSGIVDCSGYINGGLAPFFIQEDFEGVIEAGTPYMQIIPFKNEEWEHENIYYDEEQSLEHRKQMKIMYESQDIDHTTNYKEKFWTKKNYD